MTLAKHSLLPAAPFTSYRAYCEAMGGRALDRARTLGGDAVLAEIAASGLRGRGGAGFPTAVKWRSIAAHPCETRYAVCNAGEGEPGTFKDRTLLLANPYAALEGLVIAAMVVGASEAYIALKASFTKQIARVRAAIDEMRAEGALGDLVVKITEGPEEYLFGEEKALLEVVEGNDPLPREADDPPYEHGLFATATSPNPALVNNAETLAHVPSIVLAGGASFRAIGTQDTPGTLLFTVSGDVQKPGVYELPAGIPLRELFERVAGGPRPGRTFKAAMSGVSSAVIPADKFDRPADFASLKLIGAGLGSAGFMVFDDAADMPRVAQAIARFLYVESCNQCSACKHGLGLASSALDEIFDSKKASADDLERAFYGARHAPQGNRCYLPVQGSVVIPSLLSRFRAELDARIATPTAASSPYLVPKFVDYDEATHTFTYDEAQSRKRPNWTYEDEPSAPPAPVSARRAAPRPGPAVPATARLASDVRRSLEGRAATADEVDRLVNDAIRQYLARGD